jgi:hypothetical protein
MRQTARDCRKALIRSVEGQINRALQRRFDHAPLDDDDGAGSDEQGLRRTRVAVEFAARGFRQPGLDAHEKLAWVQFNLPSLQGRSSMHSETGSNL